jgi:ferric-dicitrate binding protein FerR (iron transport regulator)
MNEQQVGKASRIASLIVRNMQDNLTTDERHELNAWLQEDGENFLLYEELMDDDKLGEALDQLHAINAESAYEKLYQKLFTGTPYKRTYKLWWYMVAAVILLVAGGITYFSMNNKTIKPAPAEAVVVAQKMAPGTLPDSKKAILTLANGENVVLNEMNNGDIAQQGTITVHKTRNGQLQYKVSAEQTSNTISYNTLHTPRGGEYQVVLDDGTRIWLNSASTLTFPIYFNKEERRVQLTGEAYFEVASSLSATTGKKKPFIVGVDNMEVQAVGTSFNISAYKEDNSTQTTVVEGLVKVSRHNQDHLLQPGKKLVTHDSTVAIENADINQATAWKNGEFVFHNTSLQMVMNELARWYDMEVIYQQPVPSLHFSGEIERESDITKVLQMLEFTGGVKFKITGRVIKVFANR